MPEVVDPGHIKRLWEYVWECNYCHRKLKFSKEEMDRAKANYHKNPDEVTPNEWRAFSQYAGLVKVMQGPCDTCETVREFGIERGQR